ECQRKLRDIRQRFTRLPGQSLPLWLYWCWFAGADGDVFLDRNEAQQLGSLSGDAAIDRGIGRRTGTLSLWRRLVCSVRKAYTAKKLMVRRDRWSTKLEGVQYLTELIMVDVLLRNTRNNQFVDDPDGAYCTWHIWLELKRSASPLYAEALSSVRWNKDLKVLKVKDYIWDYSPEPSPLPQHSCSSVEHKEYAACSDDPCTICHEELGGNSCELECGHGFHRECIRTWLQEHSSTCPICRDYAVLPAAVHESPAWNSSKLYKARPWKRPAF
ncbi:DZIP3 ligase, partial [Chaetops frenatus]|nr:DZIP3 ligase [Chaetops frenatus]